ncbi:MAG TPA: hypothetical protein VMI53_00085 [Opitutaceae bacterium]|nr:hypothetical protein [Opitutaceae bacterium]
MNQLLEPETSETTRRRGRVPRFLRDEDTQSVVIGLLLTLILWPLLVLFFSWAIAHLHGKNQGRVGVALPIARQFNIQLTPQELRPPKPPPPNRFVETNPDAPQNIPDQTRNFGAQNQQAAQPKPSPKTGGDHPATEGRKDIESTQIVNGHLSPQTPSAAAPAPPSPPSTEAKPAPVQEQNPLPGYEKGVGENKDAFGTNVAQLAENAKNVPNKIEGRKDVPLIEGANSVAPQIDPKHPRPRPMLNEHDVRPAIFSDNPTGTTNIGLASWDARWSNYGQYLQQLIDTVQAEWDHIMSQSNVYPSAGTHVVVTFRLNSKGNISAIVKVDGNAGDLGQRYCVSAITDRAPYGPWTDDMIAILGNEQELTFAFYYY